MKKLILFITIFILTSLTGFASVDTSNWYLYNGYSTTHSFSVRYPTNWIAKTFGDDLQGFGPDSNSDEVFFSIQEFEGKTYDQAIDAYAGNEKLLLSLRDVVISDNYVGKEVVFQDTATGEEVKTTFIKRGALIIALTNPKAGSYEETVGGIFDSFIFTDNWHQYIDFKENYTFIFPDSLEITTLNNGVEITDPLQFDSVVFSILKYAGVPLTSVAQIAEGYGEAYQEKVSISFHGVGDAIRATYMDETENKKFNRIFVSKNSDSFGLSDINIENNFPHLDYYDDYLLETLESFEFFDIKGETQPFKYFPDVRDDHPNSPAINFLTKAGIIAGYPNGTFLPDGEINRAELTKMIVATKTIPDAELYRDCFPDVNDEWFAPFVCYAKEQGWVAGYPDGTFKPEQNINRVEAIKIVLKVIFNDIPEDEEIKDKEIDDVSYEDWYSKYFIFAYNRDLLDKQHITPEGGKYSYHPDENMTRKEVSEMIYRSLSALVLP